MALRTETTTLSRLESKLTLYLVDAEGAFLGHALFILAQRDATLYMRSTYVIVGCITNPVLDPILLTRKVRMRRPTGLVCSVIALGIFGSLLQAQVGQLWRYSSEQQPEAPRGVEKESEEDPGVESPSETSKMRERAPQKKRRPIVFMMADDLRADFATKTPNLRRLASESLVFERAYCQAPVCNPSRNSFLTGAMPDISKVYYFEATTEETMGARGSQSFFSVLRSHGYASYGTGKLYHWDLLGAPFSSDYACLESTNVRCTFDYFPREYNQEWGREEDAEPNSRSRKDVYLTSEEDLFDLKVTKRAVEYLKVGARDYFAEDSLPFILGVGWHHPHLEWRVPRRLFSTENVSVARDHRPTIGAPGWAFGDIALGSKAELELLDGTILQWTDFSVDRPDHENMPRLRDEAARELRAGYLGCVKFVDEQVGTMMSEMRNLGLWDDDAVVVFTSDHGYGLGERGHWGKVSLYEIDARVPLFVRDPVSKRRIGEKSRALVELLDVGKTIIDFGGVSPSHYATIGGRSFRSVFYRGDEDWNYARRIATTMLPKRTEAREFPFDCRGKSFNWPADAVLGVSARSSRHRYVAWMRFNTTIDGVDWSLAPLAEELYSYDEDDGPDDWDSINLLAHGNAFLTHNPQSLQTYRSIADDHLSLLRASARRRHSAAYGQYPFRFSNDKFGSASLEW